MRKYNNPRLLNTIVSGTGMQHPVKPHVIISDTVTEFVKGDLMEANAISELIDQKISNIDNSSDNEEVLAQLNQAVADEATARSTEDTRLDLRITSVVSSIPQAVADGIAKVVAGADEDYDTLKEISDYIASDKVGAAQMSNAINSNATSIAGEVSRATAAESALSDRIDALAVSSADTSAVTAETTRATAKEAELESAIANKADKSTTYTKDEVNQLVNGVDVSSQLTDYALKTNVDDLATVVSDNNTAINSKVDTLGSTLEDRISDVEDNMPTKVSDLTNDAGNKLSGHYETLYDQQISPYRNGPSHVGITGLAFDIVPGDTYRVTINDNAVEVQAILIVSSGVTYNIIALPDAELNATPYYLGWSIAMYQMGAGLYTNIYLYMPDMEDSSAVQSVKVEHLTPSTIDSKYIPSEFVTDTEMSAAIQTAADQKLDKTASVSELDNDANYISRSKNWEAGDYLYSDYTVSKKLDSSKTVIGVCVAPASHFADGKARFISISEDTEFDVATIAATYSSDAISAITIVNADTTFNSYKTWNSDDVAANGGFGFDFQPQSMGASDSINGAYYVKGLSAGKYATVVPAPFDADGSQNTLYFAGSSNNLLSTVRESNGEWYYPTAGEIGYLIYFRDILDEKLNAANGMLIGDDANKVYITTSALSDSRLFGVKVRNGQFIGLSANGTGVTSRKFIAVVQPGVIFKDAEDNIDIALRSDIPTKTSDLINDSGFLTSHQDVSGKANITDLATVATSGSYTDLTDKPSNISEFANDAGYLTSHQDLSSYATTQFVNDKFDDMLGINADGVTAIANVLADEDTTTGLLVEIANKANSSDLATVATTGNYSDLDNAPIVPDLATNGHEYVDLGLPSGTLWATMNIGASSQTDYGQYFQWGDTQGYASDQIGSEDGQKYFGLSDYKYYDGTTDESGYVIMTKYNPTDKLTALELSDDAARANWGGYWHMPTMNNIRELLDSSNCTNSRVAIDGVYGRLFTSNTNGNTLFVPYAGAYRNGEGLFSGSAEGWSSSLYTGPLQKGGSAEGWTCGWDKCSTNSDYRYTGYTVRGVLDPIVPTFNKIAFTGSYNDLTDKPAVVEQVQANWAETDTTSVAYILNKPFVPTLWTGTQAEYDAIESPSVDTIYFIKG